jgi:cytochrome c5
MNERVALLLALSGVAACSPPPDEAAAPQAAAAAGEAAEEIRTFSGAEAYQLACARCHEQGENGAPRTGDAAAWAGRSPLWEAVLFEHAKKGYGNMPAKGGNESLDDAVVERAAEYMLRQVYPDAPPD